MRLLQEWVGMDIKGAEEVMMEEDEGMTIDEDGIMIGMAGAKTHMTLRNTEGWWRHRQLDIPKECFLFEH